MKKRLAFAVFALVVCGGATCLPPCLPPDPLTWADGCAPSPNSGADFKNWGSTVLGVQIGVEDVVYSGKVTFTSLSPAFQAANQADYLKAFSTIRDADTGYISAVNAVIAAQGSDYSKAIADAEAAVEAFMEAIEQIATAASSAAKTSADHTSVAAAHNTIAKMRAQATESFGH